ncbi:hypothetical protein BDR26DRAFT_853375 [Obelidium mucronatum]|nr:hypothetical protein BDR26DRAFT_853375 [Obelidium mucronatum]
MKKGAAAASKAKKGAKEEAAIETSLAPTTPAPIVDEVLPAEVPAMERKPVDRSFLDKCVDPAQISRVDRTLKKVFSLPGLSCSPPTPQTKESLSPVAPHPGDPAKFSAEPDLDIPETQAQSANLQTTQKTKRVATSAQTLSVQTEESLRVEKPPRKADVDFMDLQKRLNENMDDELEAAIRLRDRRITRRRNRALGVPPDPNDSDDSLLAEMNDTTDEKLFPGFSFIKKDAKPVLKSINPVRLNVPLLKEKVVPRENGSSRGGYEDKESVFLKQHPKEVFASFTPETRRDFESLVLQKFYRHGAITGFKGKQDIQNMKLKSIAKHEIEDIQQDADKTEKNLLELNSHLDECRTNVTKHTAKCIEIIKEINHMAETEPHLQIEPHLANPKTQHAKSKKDALNFPLPIAPHLLQNRKFRMLSSAYTQSATIAKDSMRLIPYLEAEIVPVEHHLTILDLQLSRLDGLRQDILESDLIDALEMYVVDKYKKVEEKKRKERIRAAEQVIEEASCEAAKKRKQSMQAMFLKNPRFEELDEHCVPPGIAFPNIHSQREPLTKQEHHLAEQETRKLNLQKLQARVTKIRKAIAENILLTHHDDQDTSELFLADGEVDLSETPIVRETRRAIVAKKADLEKQHIRQLEEQVKSKMRIVQKVMDIEDLERKDHAEQQSIMELHKALESLAPRPQAAFPVEIDPKQVQILKSRLKERPSPSPEYMNKEVPLPTKQVPINSSTPETATKPKRPPLPPPNHKVEPRVQEALPTKIINPFLPDPHTVMFVDYDPEKIYSKTVKITNTSCRVNTFKLLPISVELATFFEVTAPTPGRMSAGMVCEVKFTFKPPAGYNQDISDGVIEFEAEYGGKFFVKLGCSSKKCKPRISSVCGPGLMTEKLDAEFSGNGKERMCEVLSKSEVKVNFGGCVQGGTTIRTIGIRNDGAVSTEVQVTRCLDGDAGGPFFLSNSGTSVMKIDGYGTLDLNLAFQPPRQSGNVDKDVETRGVYILKFSTPGVLPITIACHGEILHSPLRIDKNSLDFGISVVDCTYRESVIVKNHSNIAIKYWVEIEGMTLRSQVTTAAKASRGTASSEKSVDWGSDICTDGVDSDSGEAALELTRLSFFSEDDMIEEDETADEAGDTVPSNPAGTANLTAPALKTRAASNNLLLPGNGYGSNWSAGGGANRAASFILHEDQQQFSIRPIKRSSRNPAAMSKRTDNLDVEVQNMGELEISPKLAIIQPFETSKIWFKVKPSRSGHILLKNGENPYSVQVQIKYMNQGVETPTSLSLTGRVTTSDISFSILGKTGKEVSFNECTLSEAKEVPIKITNNSRIPQKVWFNTSDPSIRVVFKKPHDIHGTVPIEPLASEIRMVRFEPTDPGSIKARLSCHSIWNRNFELKCAGVGLKNLLRLENSELRFGAVGLGSSKTQSIRILCHGSKTTSFGSSLNISKISSVVKQVWSKSNPAVVHKRDDGHFGNHDDTNRQNEETVTFEFGNPKIIGIYKRNKLQELYEVTSTATDRVSREICLEADAAVQRTDPTLLRAFRPILMPPSSIPEFNPKEIDPEALFSAGSCVAANPRILVPAEVDTFQESSDSQKLASISFEDPSPVIMSPKKGILGPGDALEVEVKLAIPSITHLAVYKIIQDQIKAEEAEAKAAADILLPLAGGGLSVEPVEERTRRSSVIPAEKTKEEKPKKEKESDKTKAVSSVSIADIIPTVVEPVVYPVYDVIKSVSQVPETLVFKPPIVKIYERLDDTCISILVPCKTHRTTPSKRGHGTAPDDEKPKASAGIKKKFNELIYLRIIAPIVTPDLILVEPESGVIDFGTIPVHKEEVREFVIYNESKSGLELGNFAPFQNGSPFKLLTDLKHSCIQPFSKFTVQIAFVPSRELSFTEFFSIFSTTSQIQVRLIGQGVVPTIRVEPSESTDIFMGDMAIGDCSTKSFKVFNTSYDPVTCHVELAADKFHGTQNFNKTNPFSITPWHTKIEPDSFQEFTVKFSPDRESDLFFDTVTVNPWGAVSTTSFQVHGRCWDTSSVLLGYDRPSTLIQEFGLAQTPSLEYEYALKMLYGEFPRPQPITLKDEEDDIEAEAVLPSATNSTLSIAGGGGNGQGVTSLKQPAGSVITGSTSKLAVDKKKPAAAAAAAPSPAKDKDSAKDAGAAAAGKQEPEEVIAEAIHFTNRVHSRFVTLTCPWKLREEDGKWCIDPKNLVIASIKPANFVKPDTKRPATTEYSIEAWNGGAFEYSELTRGFSVVSPAPSGNPHESTAHFEMDGGANSRGSIDFGASKDVVVKLVNPAHDFANALSKLKRSVMMDKKTGSERHRGDDETQDACFFNSPIHVETYFKVTLKGGFRYSEPKGLIPLAENRVWYVKVQTDESAIRQK